MIGYACILLSILSVALLHTIYRMAGQRKCKPEVVNASFLTWASLVALAAGALLQPNGFHLPDESRARFIWLAVGLGAMVPLGIAFYMAALRVGKLAPSAMVIGLSVTVPIFGSILLFGEKLTTTRGVAVGLALISIVLLWLDKRGGEGDSDVA